MRHPLALIAVAAVLYASAAQAQTDTAAPATAVSTASPETSTPTPAPDPKPARLTWEQRFAQANTTHDGRLTLEQANGGYRTIARNFAAIDVGGKGYVTEDDIRAWHKSRHTSRQTPPPPNPQGMQLQHAYQRMFQQPLQINTATQQTVTLPAPSPQAAQPWDPGLKPDDP